MCEFAMKQDEVKLLAASERMADAETDFSGSEDTDWQKRFQYEPRSTVLKNNLHNITLILQNDPQLQNIVFNSWTAWRSRAMCLGSTRPNTGGTLTMPS